MSGEQRPISVADLIDLSRGMGGRPETDWARDYWFWCRRHEQAHKVGEKCRCDCSWKDQMPEHQVPTDSPPCIDIGPFMSEREANRLAGSVSRPVVEPIRSRQLGMDVER